MDLEMPQMDGVDCCRVIKSKPGSAAIPIVMITARGDEASRASCLSAGCNGFLNQAAGQEDIPGYGWQIRCLIGREARGFGSNPLKRQAPPENQKEGAAWRRESFNLKRTGEEFPVLLTSIPVRDKEKRYVGIVTTCEDISEQKKAEERINRLAYFDLLTGLPNRGMFLDRLHQSLAQAKGDGNRVSLVFLDLDNFKDVNDTIGHVAGDMLLCEVALRLAGWSKPTVLRPLHHLF